MHTKNENSFDAIVIGSGIGGLTTAAILSKMNKMRVLVLEQHFEIGGLTHIFSRGRYKWEVGVHYLGMMKKGRIQRAVIDYITDKCLKWLPMPDIFEQYIYSDATFGVSKNEKKYKADLIREFPTCKRAILKYFKDRNRAANWYVRRFLAASVPQPLSALFSTINFFTKRIPLMTTKEYLDAYIPNERLATMLAHRWGDYGAPPQESCFAMHALVMKHYSLGGFFPDGSSSRIASAIEQVIEKSGGTVLVNRQVTEIIVKHGRAVGVRVKDKRFLDGREESYFAPIVVSNAGAENTYGKLVKSSQAAHLAKMVTTFKPGSSSVTVYLGLKESPEKLGVRGENIWINEHNKHHDVSQQTQELVAGNPKVCYVSFPTMRGGRPKHHIAVLIAIVDYSAFEQWADQPWREKDAKYNALKERIATSMIQLTERHVPGFSDMIDYCEVATPLTMEYFTNRSRGPMYGFRPTPQFYSEQRFKVKTPIKGLYLSGTDVCAPGVGGAMMGGVATAAEMNGYFGFVRVVATARLYSRFGGKRLISRFKKSKGQGYSLHSDKIRAELVDKVKLTDTIYEFSYKSDRQTEYCAGQYARIQYNDTDYGSYSIVTAKNNILKFIIEMKFGGKYADYFHAIEPGDYSTIRFPMGDFTVRESTNRKVFISTGTGIAPQLAMLESLAKNDKSNEKASIYFGCRYAKDNFINEYLQEYDKSMNIESTICISQENVPNHVHGRVTKPLKQLNGNVNDHDFYVSGNPDMVQDVVDLLRTKGATNVYSENY